MERQMDMERRNSALRYQQLQEERDNLKQGGGGWHGEADGHGEEEQRPQVPAASGGEGQPQAGGGQVAGEGAPDPHGEGAAGRAGCRADGGAEVQISSNGSEQFGFDQRHWLYGGGSCDQ